MRVTTFDVCVPGMERLRSQSEFILLAYLQPSTTGGNIREQWLDDLQVCERPDGFNYDAARQAIESAVKDYVRPAFRRKRWNPFSVPRAADSDDGCAAYLFIEDLESESV